MRSSRVGTPLPRSVKAKIELLEKDIALLRYALDKSVRLQAHYATLLNQWDGGNRRIFAGSYEWLKRLEEMGRNDE